MKKLLVLILFAMILACSLSAVNIAKSYVQKVVANDGTDLLASLITNTGTTTSPNYEIKAWMLAAPTDILQTGVSTLASIRVAKVTASPAYAMLTVSLGNFQRQWVAGDVLHVQFKYIGAGAHNGEIRYWEITVPNDAVAGTPMRYIPGYTEVWQSIPPLAPVADPNPTLATTPVPANAATNVSKDITTIGWTYTANAAYTNPTSYKVYFGTANPPTNLLATVNGGPGTYTTAVSGLAYETTYYWKVVPTNSSGKAMNVKVQPVVMSRNQRMASAAKGDAVGANVWSFTTENAPILDKNIDVYSNIDGVRIMKDGVVTAFTTPHTFVLPIGETHTFAVQNIPTMVTPAAQSVTVTDNATLAFTYESIPNVGVTYGSTVATPAAVAAGAPITVPAVAGNYNFVFTPHAPGLVVFTIKQPNAAKINTNTYAGYQNVWQVFQVYTDDTSTLNGTDVSITYTNDLPYEVAVNWGAWYPHVGPWSGYVFNGGPMTSLAQPLIAFGANSHYVNGVTNTLTVGPLPSIAPGAYTLELVLNDGDHTLPVELSSFTALSTAQMFVNLQWVTESETNNLGFNVLRSNVNDLSTAEKVNVDLIAGTNNESQHSYTFVDKDVVANGTYYYWLEIVSLGGTSQFSNFVTVTVNPTTPTPVPTVTTLSKAYPNPFSLNHSTTMNVNVKANDKATVTVYNILGQVVTTQIFNTGAHTFTWNGKDSKGNAVGCGVYFAKMASSSANMTQKMVIVK